ncbi:MAG: helix-turn-helix domain-containing protein [Gemmatimonadota bacterium]
MGVIERITGSTRARLLGLLRRSAQTVGELAETVGVTDNAVRMHMAALERDGMVERVGERRGTGGRAAAEYRLTDAAESLYPKAYAAALSLVLREVEDSDGRERVLELLRGAGERAGRALLEAGAVSPRTNGARAGVDAAAQGLRALGADLDVQETESGWRLAGYACPLMEVVAADPRACLLAHAMVEQLAGLPAVRECDTEGRPRCRFRIEDDGTESARGR